MKVILMRKVERLGEPGQQVEVAPGYARNFLLPRQWAVPATPGHLRSMAQLKAQTKNREERAKQEAGEMAERLATVALRMVRRASDEGAAAPEALVAALSSTDAAPSPPLRAARLFGSVTAQDISEALQARGLRVEKKQVLLAEPIKTLGVHRVPIRLHPDVVAEITVTVERQN